MRPARRRAPLRPAEGTRAQDDTGNHAGRATAASGGSRATSDAAATTILRPFQPSRISEPRSAGRVTTQHALERSGDIRRQCCPRGGVPSRGRRGADRRPHIAAAAADHVTETLHQHGRGAVRAAVETAGPPLGLALGAHEHLFAGNDRTTPGRGTRLGVDLASSAAEASHSTDGASSAAGYGGQAASVASASR